MSGRRIFFSRVNFLCWLLFNVCSTPMLLHWHVRLWSFCQKCRWWVTLKHAYTLDPTKSRVGWPCWETSPHATRKGTFGHSLSHCGLILAPQKVEMVCTSWSPLIKKKKNRWTFPQSPHTHTKKKPPAKERFHCTAELGSWKYTRHRKIKHNNFTVALHFWLVLCHHFVFFCIFFFMEVVHPFSRRCTVYVTILNFSATWEATFHLQGLILCKLCFRVSEQWHGCHCLGYFTCTQMLMHVIAHGAVWTL